MQKRKRFTTRSLSRYKWRNSALMTLRWWENKHSNFETILSTWLSWTLSKASSLQGPVGISSRLLLWKGTKSEYYRHLDINQTERLVSKPYNGSSGKHKRWQPNSTFRTKKKARICRYFVDGIHERTKTVYKYNECIFHRLSVQWTKTAFLLDPILWKRHTKRGKRGEYTSKDVATVWRWSSPVNSWKNGKIQIPINF